MTIKRDLFIDYGTIRSLAEAEMERAIVRTAMETIEAKSNTTGSLGPLDIYLTFSTPACGKGLPGHLRVKHPEEMVIRLTTTGVGPNFSHLNVGEDAFSVSLLFAGLLQRLTIPFVSLTKYYDPLGFYVADLQVSLLSGKRPRSARTRAKSALARTSATIVSLNDFRGLK